MGSSLDIHSLYNVQGYVAIVTGGSSGLGFMICRALVLNGAKIYLIALPSEPIDEKVAELNALVSSAASPSSVTPVSLNAIGYACDVSSKSAIANFAAYIKSREPHIDLLVSNAGIRRDPLISCDVLHASLEDLQASMWSHTEENWANTFAVNTTAHYFLGVAMMPLLAEAAKNGAGRGAIVVTSSCASMHNATNVDLSSYAASKAATDHLVRLLAAKFARWCIRVNGINPGFLPSNMNPVGAEGNMFANLFDKVPAKRAGNAEDIAGAVMYLGSRAGAYVNGISLVVDGGRILFANGQQ